MTLLPLSIAWPTLYGHVRYDTHRTAAAIQVFATEAERSPDKDHALQTTGFIQDQEGISIYNVDADARHILFFDLQVDSFRIFPRKDTPADPHGHPFIGAVELPIIRSDDAEATNDTIPFTSN